MVLLTTTTAFESRDVPAGVGTLERMEEAALRVAEVVDATWDASGPPSCVASVLGSTSGLLGAPEAPDAVSMTSALVVAGVSANMFADTFGALAPLLAAGFAFLVAAPLRLALKHRSKATDGRFLTSEAVSVLQHGARGLRLLAASDAQRGAKSDALAAVGEAASLLAEERSVAIRQEQILYGQHFDGTTSAADRALRLVAPEVLPGEPAPRWEALRGVRREAFLSLEEQRLALLSEAARVCLIVEDLGEMESIARSARLQHEKEARSLDAARHHRSPGSVDPLDVSSLEERLSHHEVFAAARRELREDLSHAERLTRTEAS